MEERYEKKPALVGKLFTSGNEVLEVDSSVMPVSLEYDTSQYQGGGYIKYKMMILILG